MFFRLLDKHFFLEGLSQILPPPSMHGIFTILVASYSMATTDNNHENQKRPAEFYPSKEVRNT